MVAGRRRPEPGYWGRLERDGTRLLACVPAAALAACVFRPAPSWPDVLSEVCARYPEVAQVSVEELRAREPDSPALLLDARTAEEYAVSHLSGARHAPDEEAALEELRGIPLEREIVVYCSVGLRSSALAERLRSHGFTRVANLEGGIFAWANADLPVQGSAGERVDVVHPFDERWGTLLAPGRRARDAGSGE